MQKLYFFILILAGILAAGCKGGGGDIVKPKPGAKIVEPTVLTPDPAVATANFEKWKRIYITSEGCPKGKRVLFDDGTSTVSEGMAYGMLGAVFTKDKPLFDDLFLYYNHFKDSYGLMHWKINGNGRVTGSNAATDADEDVAIALLLADKYWGSKGTLSYIDSAKNIINAMLEHCVEKETYVLKPGDAWGGSNTTNPSYFAPAYYKIYYQVTGDSSWLKVSDKCYEILNLAMHPSTGLVPDWCKANGQTPASSVSWAYEGGTKYYYDACRTPWRIANDVLWFNDPRGVRYCSIITGFLNRINVRSIGDGYNLDGTPISGNTSSAFIGSFGCAAYVRSPGSSLANSLYSSTVKSGSGYYNETMKMLTLLFQTGMWDKP